MAPPKKFLWQKSRLFWNAPYIFLHFGQSWPLSDLEHRLYTNKNTYCLQKNFFFVIYSYKRVTLFYANPFHHNFIFTGSQTPSYFFGFCFAFSSFSFQKISFLMKNSQMQNQFHKRDFLSYASNFSLKFVFLSIGKVKCYTRYTKHVLVGYVL